jgi:hypothetical protein
LLDAVSAKFSGRHQQIGQLFKERFRQLREVASLDQDLSEQRQLLIGAYFVSTAVGRHLCNIRSGSVGGHRRGCGRLAASAARREGAHRKDVPAVKVWPNSWTASFNKRSRISSDTTQAPAKTPIKAARKPPTMTAGA